MLVCSSALINVYGDYRQGGKELGRKETVVRQKKPKRHRAAALHDAGANSKAPLFPPGFGVRQPYAASVAPIGDRPSVRWPHAAPLWSFGSPEVVSYNSGLYHVEEALSTPLLLRVR
jgi:hypothetical protein